MTLMPLLGRERRGSHPEVAQLKLQDLNSNAGPSQAS